MIISGIGNTRGEMLSDIELALLAGFFPRPAQRLLPVIQRQVSYPREEIYPTLRGLAARGVVDITDIGGTTVFTLNVGLDDAESGYLFYARMRLEEAKGKYPGIFAAIDKRVAAVEDDIILLCGNYAKGTAKDSGTAIVVGITEEETASDGGNAASTLDFVNAPASLSDMNSENERDHMDILRIIHITIRELRDMKTSGSETFHDMVNYCIPLRGTALYFQWLYRKIGV